ncbi:MAG: alpha-ketoacid dehydrogenase subunit beta [Actinomycetota bacterium]
MMPETTMAEALNAALRKSLADDDKVLVLGEDIGKLGGVFRITDKLQDEFGPERVFDTPLAESAILGVSVGLSLYGYKPVSEIQFDGFVYPSFNQIVSHVAKYRYRSRGRAAMSLVVRIPFAGEIGAAEHHSESPEAYFAHTAGLKVVIPSNPDDAYDLLIQSINDPDPVIFLEPKSRYWTKQEAAIGRSTLPLGKARVVREGDACTLIAYGAMVQRCLQTAVAAAEDGVEVEVIDLRSLVPLDIETVASSVTKTSRAIVVHEAPLTAGFGAEVVAQVTERAFLKLEAPILRVTGWDTPYPAAKVEKHYVPSVDRILGAIDRVLTF